MKSLLCCAFWVSWLWLQKPYLKWIFGSYSSDFSIRDSLKTRDIIRSPWYQSNFGHLYKMNRALSDYLENDKTGYRIATSVEGIGTGARAHIVVCDDLIKANDAFREAKLKRAVDFQRAMATRAANPKEFYNLLIMQRLNEGDPTAWALENGYEALILPGEFELSRKCFTSIGFEDPRKKEGELLWPERNNSDVMEELKKSLGSYRYAAEIQQRPAPIEGGIIKLSWWKYYELIKDIQGNILSPRFDFIYQSWDTAFKEGQENDYSVCTTWGYSPTVGYCLIDRWKGKVDFPGLENIAISLANKYRPNEVGIEDCASGQSLIQSLKKRTVLPIKAVKVDRDKVARVHAVSPIIESGNVLLPQGAEWAPDFIENLSVFPNGKHDDDVDSATQALSRLILYRSKIGQSVGSLIGR